MISNRCPVGIPLLIICMSLSACIYVPPVWDAGNSIRKIDGNKLCQSTRTDVLAILGEPDGVDDAAYFGEGDTSDLLTESERKSLKYKRARTFRYYGNDSDGLFVGIVPWQGPSYGYLNREVWRIQVEFDDNGIVRAISSSKNGNEPVTSDCTKREAEMVQPPSIKD